MPTARARAYCRISAPACCPSKCLPLLLLSVLSREPVLSVVADASTLSSTTSMHLCDAAALHSFGSTACDGLHLMLLHVVVEFYSKLFDCASKEQVLTLIKSRTCCRTSYQTAALRVSPAARVLPVNVFDEAVSMLVQCKNSKRHKSAILRFKTELVQYDALVAIFSSSVGQLCKRCSIAWSLCSLQSVHFELSLLSRCYIQLSYCAVSDSANQQQQHVLEHTSTDP
jgi:hypothetical protein